VKAQTLLKQERQMTEEVAEYALAWPDRGHFSKDPVTNGANTNVIGEWNICERQGERRETGRENGWESGRVGECPKFGQKLQK
jgi:hypothetical protein